MQEVNETPFHGQPSEYREAELNGKGLSINLPCENSKEVDIIYYHGGEAAARLIYLNNKLTVIGLTSKKLNLTGKFSCKSIEIMGNGHVEISAKLYGKSETFIQAQNITIAKNAVVNAKQLAINSPGFLLNKGRINGNEITLKSFKFSNFKNIRANKLQIEVEKNILNCGLIRSRLLTELKGSSLLNRGKMDSKHTLRANFNEVRLEEGEVSVNGYYEANAKIYIDNAITTAAGYSAIKADEITFSGLQKFNVADIRSTKQLLFAKGNSIYITQHLDLHSDEKAVIDGLINYTDHFNNGHSKIALNETPIGFKLNSAEISFFAKADLGEIPVTMTALGKINIGNENYFSYSSQIQNTAAIFMKANIINNQGSIDTKYILARANTIFINRGFISSHFTSIDATTLINTWHIHAPDQFNVNCIANVNAGVIRSSVQILNGLFTYNGGLQLFELPTELRSLLSKTKLFMGVKLLAGNIMPQLASFINFVFSCFHLYNYYPHLREHLQGLYGKIRQQGMTSIEMTDLLPTITLAKDVCMSVYSAVPHARQLHRDFSTVPKFSFNLEGITENKALLAFEALQLIAPKSYCDNLMTVNSSIIATLNYSQRSIEDQDSGIKTALQLNLEAHQFAQCGLWAAPNLHVNGGDFNAYGKIYAGWYSVVAVKTMHAHQKSYLCLYGAKILCSDFIVDSAFDAVKTEIAVLSESTLGKDSAISLAYSSLTAKSINHFGKLHAINALLSAEKVNLDCVTEGFDLQILADTVKISNELNLNESLKVKANKELEFLKDTKAQLGALFIDAANTNLNCNIHVAGPAIYSGQNLYIYADLYVKEHLSAKYNREIAILAGSKVDAQSIEVSSLIFRANRSRLIGRSSIRQHSVIELSFLCFRESPLVIGKTIIGLPISFNLRQYNSWSEIFSRANLLTTLRIIGTNLPIPHMQLLRLALTAYDLAYATYDIGDRLYSLLENKSLKDLETSDMVPIIVDSVDTIITAAMVKIEYDTYMQANQKQKPLTYFQKLAIN